MELTQALLHGSIAVGGMMVVMWSLSVVLKDASIVDIGWGLGFVLIAWVVFTSSLRTERCVLICVLTSLWGVRLSGYLAKRNIGKGEDYRYVAMREKHGSRFAVISFFTVFLLQGVVMLIVALPIMTGQTSEAATPLNALSWLGVGFWTVGLAFEAGGDWPPRPVCGT